MGKMIDISGQKFGRLTVLSITNLRQKNGGGVIWNCLCDCGQTTQVLGYHLRSGQTKSCGCFFLECAAEKGKKKKKHGMTKTPAYKSWSGMKDRCFNKKNKKYHAYGGRGITVCEEWASSFEVFIKDMGIPADGESIDRIDVNGNYCPSNCRWASQKIQQNNRRNNRIVLVDGVEMTLSEYVDKNNLDYEKTRRRLSDGWTLSRASL